MSRRNKCAGLVRILSLFVLCAGLLAYSTSPIYAAPGDLDVSFGDDGKVVTPIGNGTARATAVAIQPDGKIVVAGYALINGNGDDFVVMRYNLDGSLDTTFDHDGIVTTDIDGGMDWATGVAVQPDDGKIVVAGHAYNGATGSDDFAVVRYESDGTLDSDFGNSGVVLTDFDGNQDHASGLVLWNDGSETKIVLAGSANMDTTGYDFALARYTSAGAPDTTFGGDGRVTTQIGSALTANEMAYALTIQPDGKLIASGYAIMEGTLPDFALVRYNTDGSPDTSFGEDGIVTTNVSNANADDYANAVIVQSDGKIVAAGYAAMNTTGYDFAVVRYTPDGALDDEFGDGGIVTTWMGSATSDAEDRGNGIAEQANGKLVVAGLTNRGSPTGYDFALVRYSETGELDGSFGGGKVTTAIGDGATDDSASAVAVKPDGTIVAVGQSAGAFTVVQYEGDPVPLAGLEIPAGPYTVTDGKIQVPVNLAFSLVDLGAVAFSLGY